jgi:chromosome segregation ATPase
MLLGTLALSALLYKPLWDIYSAYQARHAANAVSRELPIVYADAEINQPQTGNIKNESRRTRLEGEIRSLEVTLAKYESSLEKAIEALNQLNTDPSLRTNRPETRASQNSTIKTLRESYQATYELLSAKRNDLSKLNQEFKFPIETTVQTLIPQLIVFCLNFLTMLLIARMSRKSK